MTNATLIRPRLTDHHGIFVAQERLDFVIPFVSEDLPLYVDPFLMWRSPSQQDQSLHESLIGAFNHLGILARNGKEDDALNTLIACSECDEVGLGNSSKRKGKRISKQQAKHILDLFQQLPHYANAGCQHMEEIQLYVDGISKDRVSDFACNFTKSFLIDFTMDQCEKLGIPMADVDIGSVYSQRDRRFKSAGILKLPVNPQSNGPIIFVPKRWLRYVPWINYEEYYRAYCPQDDIAHEGEALDHVKVLQYNRENYGVVEAYVREKERSFADCANDPLFRQIPILSAKRHLTRLKGLPTGTTDHADKEYEHIMEALLPSLLYPHCDFATAQSRTDSGVSIRDLVFYNNRDHPFLAEIFADYGARQLVFEMKNVHEVQSEHIDQLNRYLAPELGKFGVLITRHELKRARLKQTIDLWSGQRKAIIVLTDDDIGTMVELLESKQRIPLDVLKKKHFLFRQACPV
jgi:hypothetical protein